MKYGVNYMQFTKYNQPPELVLDMIQDTMLYHL